MRCWIEATAGPRRLWSIAARSIRAPATYSGSRPSQATMAKQITLRLTAPQKEFVLSGAPHPGMAAGYGAGKSQAAVVRIALRACQYAKLSFAFVESTIALVRLTASQQFTALLTVGGI